MRPQPLEAEHSVVHMAVSLWHRPDQARALAMRFPVIGDYLARVRLTADLGFDYLDPSMDRPGHLTVWGDKLLLAQSVVDIFPIT